MYFTGIWWRVRGGGDAVGLPAGGGPGLRRGRALPGPGPTQHYDLRPARVLGRPGGAPLPTLRGRFFQPERGKSKGLCVPGNAVKGLRTAPHPSPLRE